MCCFRRYNSCGCNSGCRRRCYHCCTTCCDDGGNSNSCCSNPCCGNSGCGNSGSCGGNASYRNGYNDGYAAGYQNGYDVGISNCIMPLNSSASANDCGCSSGTASYTSASYYDASMAGGCY